MRRAGLEHVTINPTEGHPVVTADWLHAKGAPTILVYGHYDVQPPDPLEKWQSPPFQPQVRNHRLYARGVSDDKGPMLIPIKTAEAFLKTVGKLKKPVLLKRGMAATINELLLSAEYVLAEGNENVILCERGVRSFDPAARNMFDLTAIPIVHRLSHLPIIADPSHGTGLRDKVIPMARAAIAAGADGVMIEVHPEPDRALSDGAQSLYPDQFTQLVGELRAVAAAIGRSVPSARSGTA